MYKPERNSKYCFLILLFALTQYKISTNICSVTNIKISTMSHTKLSYRQEKKRGNSIIRFGEKFKLIII